MSFLHEIAVRARYDGSFTQEWPTIRSALCREGGLRNIPGKSDIQKLKTWAERQGLLMDFDMESVGFMSAIRSVTFSNAGEAAVQGGGEQTGAAEEGPVSSVALDGAPKEYFDWDAVGCR